MLMLYKNPSPIIMFINNFKNLQCQLWEQSNSEMIVLREQDMNQFLFLMAIDRTKYIQQKQMKAFDTNSLALVKFEPHQILFLHKDTRKLYRYFDLAQHPQPFCNFEHPLLLKSIPFDQGVIYLKEQSTLMKQVQTRNRSFVKQYFSEQEITNTFLPLFQCLHLMHQQNVIHGSIHLDNIVMIDQEIKLRDSLAPNKLAKEYYSEKITIKDDFRALGLCLINCLLLDTSKPDLSRTEEFLEQRLEKLSRNFVIATLIIIRQLKEHYFIISKLLNQTLNIANEQLSQIYVTFKIEKQRKRKQALGQINQISQGFQFSNTKKFAISNGTKKVIHYQNIENKIQNSDGKRSNEKLIKVVQKGTLAQQLMNKRLNEEQRKYKEQFIKRMNVKCPILNLSNSGIQNSSKKTFQKQQYSPLNKIRSFSKKK